MACNQPDEPKGTRQYVISGPGDLINIQTSGYKLFLSNWPENLNNQTLPTGAGVLWHEPVNTQATSQRIRMFIWHSHKGPQPFPQIYLGTTLENLSQTNTLRIANPLKEKRTAPATNALPIGICLAKATLGQTLDSFIPHDSTIGPGTTSIIEEYGPTSGGDPDANPPVPGTTIGIIYDFTIEIATGSPPMNFNLRVAASTSPNTAQQKGAPVPGSSGGGRGTWQYNQRSAKVVFSEPSPRDVFWSITRANGPDLEPFKAIHSNDSANAIDNSGNYGVIYDPIVTEVDNLGSPYAFPVRTRLAAQNTGWPYGGAVDRGVGVRGVPPIEYDPATQSGEVVFLYDIDVPPDSTVSKSFKLMHAGAATMPVAILMHVLTQQ